MAETVDGLDDIALSRRQVETAAEVASPSRSLPTTKIRAPQLPSALLPRPALLQRLQAWHRHRLTLITALSEDLSVAEIAERLILSPATTRSYLSRLYTTLGVKNRAEAVAWARSR